MEYDFNSILDREKSGAVKYDLREIHGVEGIIPMWVADMDFKSPRSIIDAVSERAAHGIFGYTYVQDSYNEAVCHWMEARNNWSH